MMKLNLLFTISAVLLLFFGAGFVILPVQVFGIYGVTLDAAGIMLAHVAGAAVFALGVLAAIFRNNTDPATNRLVVIAIGSFFVIKTVVTLLAQLGNVFNALGWSIVAIDVLLLLGYAYFLLVRRDWSSQAA